ncbi:MAG: hypothetical protein FWD52_07625 [Candidatus Bathyarchaeota archaeon]|nr:hypothetical protein [Candidatus Termiticorpusculum sp.]
MVVVYSVIGYDVMKTPAVVPAVADVRRKTFVARGDLLNRMSEIAKEQGCSLFDLVNDLFQLVLVSDGLDFSLKRVVEERRVLEVAKGSGFILGLERLWYEMTDIAYQKDPVSALKSWFDCGVWFAAHYAAVGDGGVGFSFDQFKADLVAFTWNAPEFDFELTSDDEVFVKVTSPRFTEAYTFLFASFLVGALENFGYVLVSKEVSRGMIRISCCKELVVCK